MPVYTRHLNETWEAGTHHKRVIKLRRSKTDDTKNDFVNDDDDDDSIQCNQRTRTKYLLDRNFYIGGPLNL